MSQRNGNRRSIKSRIDLQNGIRRNGNFCETEMDETGFGETATVEAGFIVTVFGELGFGETVFGETGISRRNSYSTKRKLVGEAGLDKNGAGISQRNRIRRDRNRRNGN